MSSLKERIEEKLEEVCNYDYQIITPLAKLILSEFAKDVEEMKLGMVDENWTWGDTKYQSNAVRFGYNECITDLRARLEGK